MTTLPKALWQALPPMTQNVGLVGMGNNAVVVRDHDSGDIIKLVGHNRLLDDPYIYDRIGRHFDTEIIALNKLFVHKADVPEMRGHGRLHPSVDVEENWLLRNVYGWIRMSYIDGLRQDKIADNFGQGFTETERNDAYYYSVGKVLGRMHKAGLQINPGDIHHDIHENSLEQVRAFVGRQCAKWEVGLPPASSSERKKTLETALREYEAVTADIFTHKRSHIFTHGDFASRNMIFSRINGQVQASHIVDFGQAGIAMPENDFVAGNLGGNSCVVAGYVDQGMPFSPDRYQLVKSVASIEKKLSILAR